MLSIPAILASLLQISISWGVQVGLLNNNVSEIIAPHKSPAASLEGSNPLSKKHLATIVEELPKGSFLKNIGLFVWISATLWWSIISRISASSKPSTDWALSLWST